MFTILGLFLNRAYFEAYAPKKQNSLTSVGRNEHVRQWPDFPFNGNESNDVDSSTDR